jgi:hypothetical protein
MILLLACYYSYISHLLVNGLEIWLYLPLTGIFKANENAPGYTNG